MEKFQLWLALSIFEMVLSYVKVDSQHIMYLTKYTLDSGQKSEKLFFWFENVGMNIKCRKATQNQRFCDLRNEDVTTK